MARIKNTDIYVFDNVPEPASFLVGSDHGDGRITKSYRLETILSLLPDFGYFTDAPADGSPYVRQDHDWVAVPPSGVGSVYSVFGRIGAVTALESDYGAFYSLLGHTHDWDEIEDKPSSFPPSAHTHVTGDITNLSKSTGFDSRYYTETESDTRFAEKVHTHVEADITDLGDYLESVDISDINATGSPSSSTFLRGDGVWEDPNTVDSVFGRTGVVTALQSDYEEFYALKEHTHVEADITDLGDYLESVNVSDINATGTPSAGTWLRGDGAWGQIVAGVSSVFGRTLDIVAEAGDYDDFLQT